MLPYHFFLTVLLSVSFNFSINANDTIQNIINNPDIIWAAEVYAVYAPNMHHFDPVAPNYVKGTNAPSILKIQSNIGDNFLEFSATLAYYALNLKEDNLNIYQDAGLNQKINFKNYNKIISSFDTMDTYDTETLQKIKQVVVQKYDHNNIKTFKVKQILYYNSKTHLMGSSPIAIAPVLDGKELFWMPVQDIKKSLDISSTSIVWASRIVRDIHQNDLKLIKGKKSLGEIFLDLIEYASITPEFSRFYYTSSPIEEMDMESVKNINKNAVELSSKDFTQIRLVQDWFWNDNQQEMSILLRFYAPITMQYVDVIGKNLEDPLFYQKPEQ